MFIWSYLINYSVHLRSPRFVAHTFVSLDIHRSDVIKPRDSEVSYFNYHINQTFVLFSVISVFSLSLTNGKIRHVLDYVKYKNSECILKKSTISLIRRQSRQPRHHLKLREQALNYFHGRNALCHK